MRQVKFYVRGNFESVEQQQEQLNEYYKKMDNAMFGDIYIDLNESGINKDRLELNKMLNELEKDDIVLVTSLNKLSRNVEHFYEIEERIKAVNGTLICTDFGSEVTNRLSLSMFKTFIQIFDNKEQENDK